MKLKWLFSHVIFATIAAGLYYYKVTGPNLVWNMFLALVAFDFAYLALVSKQFVVRLGSSLLWLFFYPNTFYMLTDIVHMHFAGSALWERSSMILFILFVASILFGVLMGILSLRIMFQVFPVRQLYGRYFVIAVLSALSSLAIHIGRYARLNSWDIFTHPLLVIRQMSQVVTRESLPFVLGFAFLQLMVLVLLDTED